MSYHFNHHATWVYSPVATISAINAVSAANWKAVVASTAVSNAARWNAAVSWSNAYNARTAAAVYGVASNCAAPAVNACAAPAVSSCARPVLSGYRSASACAATEYTLLYIVLMQ